MKDKEFIILLILFAALIVMCIVIKLAIWMNSFQRELRYLNNEIRRTEGEERLMWISRKRRLWLSIIPFVHY